MHRRPSVHQRMVSCHDRSCSSRRGVLRVLAAVVVLDALASRPAEAANDAVLNKLERLKRDEISQEVATPALSRLGRLEVIPSSRELHCCYTPCSPPICCRLPSNINVYGVVGWSPCLLLLQ